MLRERRRAATIACSECGAVAHGRVDGWRAYVVGGYDGEDVEVVVFCPECAARELEDS